MAQGTFFCYVHFLTSMATASLQDLGKLLNPQFPHAVVLLQGSQHLSQGESGLLRLILKYNSCNAARLLRELRTFRCVGPSVLLELALGLEQQGEVERVRVRLATRILL